MSDFGLVRRFGVMCVGAAVVSAGGSAWGQMPYPDPGRTGREAPYSARHADLMAAESRLRTAQTAVRLRFEAEEEYIAARQELETAQKEFAEASEPVLARLRETGAYRRATEEARLASELVEREKAKDPAATQPATTQPFEQSLLDAVQKRMEEQTEVSRLETTAIDNDGSARAAGVRVDAATARVGAIRSRYNAALMNDPEVMAARREVESARAMLRRGTGATDSDRPSGGGTGAFSGQGDRPPVGTPRSRGSGAGTNDPQSERGDNPTHNNPPPSTRPSPP